MSCKMSYLAVTGCLTDNAANRFIQSAASDSHHMSHTRYATTHFPSQ